jgi:hypothetical protein
MSGDLSKILLRNPREGCVTAAVFVDLLDQEEIISAFIGLLEQAVTGGDGAYDFKKRTHPHLKW